MIDGLKPYPGYKNSGVPWLGEVPEHWEVRRLKRLVKVNPSKSEARQYLNAGITAVFLAMERVGSDGRIDSSETRPVSELWNGFTYFRRNDVIVAKITPCFENGKGACLTALATEVGFGSTEFHVLRPSGRITPQFLYRITTLPEFRRLGTEAMTGAAGQQRVPPAFIEQFQAGIPPLPEQAAIVRFLDWAERRIRRVIRARQKRIKLLEEYKTALIQRVVTGQIDVRTGQTYPTYKPTGVEWLREVPAHWEMVKIRHFARVGNGATPSRSRPEYWRGGDFPWVNSSVVNRSRVTTADQFVTEMALRECHLPRLNPGTVLVAITGQGKTRGKSTVLGIDATINQHLAYVAIRQPSVIPEFLQAVLTGAYNYLRAISDDSGGTRGALTCADVRHLKMPVPSMLEQREILDRAAKECANLDEAITIDNREIDLLKEFRTRLIADVVTGKLDVREVAASLPEGPETDEPEPLDEEDAAEAEAGAGEESTDAVPEEAAA